MPIIMRCVNCGIAFRRVQSYPVNLLTTNQQARLERWLLEMPENDYVCHPCLLLLESDTAEYKRLLGYENVCVGCGKAEGESQHLNLSIISPLLAIIKSQNKTGTHPYRSKARSQLEARIREPRLIVLLLIETQLETNPGRGIPINLNSNYVCVMCLSLADKKYNRTDTTRCRQIDGHNNAGGNAEVSPRPSTIVACPSELPLHYHCSLHAASRPAAGTRRSAASRGEDVGTFPHTSALPDIHRTSLKWNKIYSKSRGLRHLSYTSTVAVAAQYPLI
ncbi:unnamed protein product [Chrysodeixis includens]|uniref:Uncharacterized protein n=1 Tax=Chrysodeixis includens TaxID=689277 RepID=A0A9N8PWL1_CHRIL|nr:unnamed protein product [Chrysodeixis includens]